MKPFLLFLAAALTCSAQAPWDGTHGNITVQTLGDARHTAISIVDADQAIQLFSVTVIYTEPCVPFGCTPLPKTKVQYVPRAVIVLVGNGRENFVGSSALVVFTLPLGHIQSVSVAEWKLGSQELFR